MTDTIEIKVGGSPTTTGTMPNINFTALSYKLTSGSNRGSLSTPSNACTNSKLSVTFGSPVIIVYTLDTQALPGLKFGHVLWSAYPTGTEGAPDATKPLTNVTDTTITITEPDHLRGNYTFFISFIKKTNVHSTNGLFAGVSKDPTIYNVAAGSSPNSLPGSPPVEM